MQVELKEFQEACKVILGAIDTRLSTTSQEDSGYNALELVAKDSKLYLNVAGKEYYTSVTLPEDTKDITEFRAVIDAKVFLKLISKLTSKYVDLYTDDKNLMVMCSGTYLFPLKVINGELIKLPKISINNVTTEFPIDSAVLNSILKYNGKDLESTSSEARRRPSQDLFYLDQDGCVTWSESSICVNNFKLVQPVKVFLNPKTVKLFKLFKDGEVNFTLGFEEVGAKLQTRIRFYDDTIDITSIAQNDISLMNSIPLNAIRDWVNKTYPYSVNLNTEDFCGAIQRLMLFDTNLQTELDKYAQFCLNSNSITITKSGNKEVVDYDSTLLPDDTEVTLYLNLDKLKKVLENSEEIGLTLSFGPAEKAILLSKGNVKNIIAVSQPKGI